jgi:hypothetical protein
MADGMEKLNGTPPPIQSKPVFPFTNAITAKLLRDYLDNQNVRVLLLDVREKEEYDNGNIVTDVGSNGSFHIAWIDPTLLDRPG